MGFLWFGIGVFVFIALLWWVFAWSAGISTQPEPRKKTEASG